MDELSHRVHALYPTSMPTYRNLSPAEKNKPLDLFLMPSGRQANPSALVLLHISMSHVPRASPLQLQGSIGAEIQSKTARPNQVP